MRITIHQPYKLSVVCGLWALWGTIILAAMAIAGETSRTDHPLALLLLGLGLVGTGVLAGCALCSARIWERLVKPGISVTQARIDLSWRIGFGLIGIALVVIALGEFSE